MPPTFSSSGQEKLYGEVRRKLGGLGYSDNLLGEGYQFRDWFDPQVRPQSVPLAAFAHYPFSYHTACFFVLLTDSARGPDAILPYRALGAPYGIVIDGERAVCWSVGKTLAKTKQVFSAKLLEVSQHFDDHAEGWSGAELLRMKNIGVSSRPRQLDFFDIGLIPELEKHVRGKLESILKETLSSGISAYKKAFNVNPDAPELYRLAFSVLAAKVLHDRQVEEFRSLGPSDLVDILREAKAYYKPSGPLVEYRPTQQAIVDGLWNRVNFENLSINSLAYIWEHSFVSQADRAKHSIYGTPYDLARSLVGRLPDEAFNVPGRLIVEPCCGHGVLLVAALERMRDLLPPGMSSEEMHGKFVAALRGFDRDPFGVEVARLCLSLADFPNRNGWRIERENVFASNVFDASLRRAKVVLCNPPFGDIDPSERIPGETMARKPAELLRRVLQLLPKDDGLLGFVLPRKFTTGRSYKQLRAKLAARFSEIDIVALPDKAFEDSGVETETVLLVAKAPSGTNESTHVSFTDISDQVWREFRSHFEFPPSLEQDKSPSEAELSLEVASSENLAELWGYLSGSPRLSDTAQMVHCGVRWEPLAEIPKGQRKGRGYQELYRSRYSSSTPKPGYEPGVTLAEGMKAFAVPGWTYVSVRPEDQHESHTSTFQYPWSAPKVVVGAARGSRAKWRLKAAADYSGLVFSQRFIAVWPGPEWTANALSAVLNSPVASAYLATKESNRDNLQQTIEAIPMPRLGAEAVARLDELVREYGQAVAAAARGTRPRSILLEIDATVLGGYDLPPRLEWAVLEFFRGFSRPVDHEFGNYYPKGMKSYIPLRQFVSPTYQRATADDFVKRAPAIEDETISDILAELG